MKGVMGHTCAREVCMSRAHIWDETKCLSPVTLVLGYRRDFCAWELVEFTLFANISLWNVGAGLRRVKGVVSICICTKRKKYKPNVGQGVSLLPGMCQGKGVPYLANIDLCCSEWPPKAPGKLAQKRQTIDTISLVIPAK